MEDYPDLTLRKKIVVVVVALVVVYLGVAAIMYCEYPKVRADMQNSARVMQERIASLFRSYAK